MILVCGEALVDLFVEAADGPALPGRAVAGGSPFNVAIGLARLGAVSGFCGGLSGDAFGQHLRGLLAAEGVDLTHAVASDRLTASGSGAIHSTWGSLIRKRGPVVIWMTGTGGLSPSTSSTISAP